jgi:transcriptional regulator with XRE-family HTH domain
MIVGDRLRELREAKKLPQGDIEKRTGLLRCYISRVENGHTVPAIETLMEKEVLSKHRKALMLFGTFHLLHRGNTGGTFPSAVELYEKEYSGVTDRP